MMSKSMKILAAALCGAVLAGCNAVEGAKEEPFVAIPAEQVVLQGRITGLATRRPVVLQNNGVSECVDKANPTGPKVLCGFLATLGQPYTPFTFGSVAKGSAYNVTVKTQPFGKVCTVTNGSGTITTAEALDITVNCVNDPAVPRYFVKVTIPSTFGSLPGAKVSLTTEEGTFDKIPAAGATSVQFDSAVFNSLTSLPLFQYTVSASTTEGGTVNKCIVTNPTNVVGTDVVPPTANVGVAPAASTAWPTVGSPAGAPVGSPCGFTIGGTLGYSAAPPAGTAVQTISGLQLKLKNVQGTTISTYDVPAFTPASASATTPIIFGGTATPTVYKSNSGAVYDVVVSAQPAGQVCIVANGGTANLYFAGITNPSNITNVNVRCRAVPTANKLRGSYEFAGGTSLATTTATANGVTTTTVTDTTYTPTGSTAVVVATPAGGSPTTTNTTSASNYRNMVTFFEDGTFLFAGHGGASGVSANQVEHGFYLYDASLARIYFTLVTDTTAGTANTPSPISGLSGSPGPLVVGGVSHYAMTSVVKTAGTRSTITGTFGPLGTTVTPNRATWNLREPLNVAGQMTGAWVTKDHREMWVYDFNTTYGYHIGVNGGAPNMQDACYTLDDYTKPTGYYTRRGSSTGCYPVGVNASGAGTVDFQSPTLANTPGFIGRMPGSESAFDGRSPSPIYFTVATPATFAAVADATYFPADTTTPAALSWCTTEVLGVRSSLNSIAINSPVYFCREHSN